jgi:hypothetical protein
MVLRHNIFGRKREPADNLAPVDQALVNEVTSQQLACSSRPMSACALLHLPADCCRATFEQEAHQSTLKRPCGRSARQQRRPHHAYLASPFSSAGPRTATAVPPTAPSTTRAHTPWLAGTRAGTTTVTADTVAPPTPTGQTVWASARVLASAR